MEEKRKCDADHNLSEVKLEIEESGALDEKNKQNDECEENSGKSEVRSEGVQDDGYERNEANKGFDEEKGYEQKMGYEGNALE